MTCNLMTLITIIYYLLLSHISSARTLFIETADVWHAEKSTSPQNYANITVKRHITHT